MGKCWQAGVALLKASRIYVNSTDLWIAFQVNICRSVLREQMCEPGKKFEQGDENTDPIVQYLALNMEVSF